MGAEREKSDIHDTVDLLGRWLTVGLASTVRCRDVERRSLPAFSPPQAGVSQERMDEASLGIDCRRA